MRDDIDPLSDYAESVSGPLPDYLIELERQTFLKTLAPQMLSGRVQGRLLAMLSHLVQPKRILEIGTFTGYSALCLAEGMQPGGELHTIEGNGEVAWLARRHFAASPYAENIVLHQGQAADIIAELPGKYDLIFLDGDKKGYPDYFKLLIDRLVPGGLLLADNVLWDGKLGKAPEDPIVSALQSYNDLLLHDDRVEVVVIPMRDGLSICRRK